MSNEKERRVLLNGAAKVYGYSGPGRIKSLTNIAYSTLKSGSDVNHAKNSLEDGHIRKPGGGRKKATTNNPDIKRHIAEIIDGYELGNPESDRDHRVGRAMSLRKIADTLESEYGIKINYVTVQNILGEMDISKQVNRKEEQVGRPNPDRNAQFGFIVKAQREYLAVGDPVISVDTKKILATLRTTVRSTVRQNRPEGLSTTTSPTGTGESQFLRSVCTQRQYRIRKSQH